jgi:hypothetical protein
MSNRHGLDPEAENTTIVFGITEVVNAVGMYPFHPRRNGEVMFDPASQYSEHFKQTSEERLFQALHLLQFHFNGYAKCMANIMDQSHREKIGFHTNMAGLAVETFYFYWSILTDDLARVIPFVMEQSPSINVHKWTFDKMMKRVVSNGLYPSLKPLFEPLEQDLSWWTLSLSYENGMRQRFMHYADSFSLNGHSENGMMHASPSVWRFNEEGIRVDADFDHLLHGSLKAFFSWLDSLEQILREQLRQRSNAENIEWNEAEDCYSFKLDVQLEDQERELAIFPRIES